MINKVILIGRLTKDPILRKTQAGASVTSFTVACSRRVAQGQEPQTDFINCVAWNVLADNVSKYTHKGSLVCVEGRIQTRTYDDPNGKRQYITEIICERVVFLDTKKNNAQTQYNEQQNEYNNSYSNYHDVTHHQSQQQSYPGYNDTEYSSGVLDISSDDLPF